MKLLTRLLATILTLLVVAEYVPGIAIAGFYEALVAAIILGVLNSVVRPILILFTFPITIVTLGLFIFVINAGLFWFAASFLEGFLVDSFFSALIGSLIVSAVSSLTSRYL